MLRVFYVFCFAVVGCSQPNNTAQMESQLADITQRLDAIEHELKIIDEDLNFAGEERVGLQKQIAALSRQR